MRSAPAHPHRLTLFIYTIMAPKTDKRTTSREKARHACAHHAGTRHDAHSRRHDRTGRI